MPARTAVGAEDDDFPAWLRHRRRSAGLTLRELSSRSEIGMPTLAAIERGRRRPTERQVEAIERVLLD